MLRLTKVFWKAFNDYLVTIDLKLGIFSSYIHTSLGFVSLMIQIIKVNFVDCVLTYYNLFAVRFFLLPLENKTKQ